MDNTAHYQTWTFDSGGISGNSWYTKTWTLSSTMLTHVRAADEHVEYVELRIEGSKSRVTAWAGLYVAYIKVEYIYNTP